MKFSRTMLLAAAATITVFCHINNVQACRGGGGGYSRGFSGGSYSSRSYGGYHGSAVSSYGYPSHSVSYGQPIRSIHSAPPASQFVSQPQTPVQHHSQPVAQPQTVTQPLTVAQQPRQAVQQLPAQPVPGRLTQPTTAPQIAQAPRPQSLPTQAPVNNAPAAQAPAAQAPAGNAQMSALQALGGFAPPATTAPPAEVVPQAPVHVGNWTAKLGNGATVQLSLEADGRFSWVATNASGSSSSFSGSYTVNNGSLNLNRSNDGQQLSGDMTVDGNDAFRFQVAGNNAAAISFARS